MQATWVELNKQAEEAQKLEPNLDGTFSQYVFKRGGLGEALSHMIADAFGSDTIPASQWQKTFMRVYDGSLGPYEEQMGSVEWLACCDLRAVPDRDSAVDNLLIPFLHFKGFKAI